MPELFELVVLPLAQSEIETAAEYIEGSAGYEVARRWTYGLIEAIESLRRFPRRCPVAPEAKQFPGQEIRHLFYSSHKIIYAITEKEVVLLRLRHMKQQAD